MTSSGVWSFMGFDFWKYDLYLFRSFYSKKNNKKIYINHNKQCLHSFYNLLKECGIPFLFKKFPGGGEWTNSPGGYRKYIYRGSSPIRKKTKFSHDFPAISI